MSTRTIIIGISFLLVLFFGAIVVDVLNWPNFIYGIPVIGLEIAFFISITFDAFLDTENCY
jgi:hypothetical protein